MLVVVLVVVQQVVVLVQPAWVVTTETSASTSGTLGLFQVSQSPANHNADLAS